MSVVRLLVWKYQWNAHILSTSIVSEPTAFRLRNAPKVKVTLSAKSSLILGENSRETREIYLNLMETPFEF